MYPTTDNNTKSAGLLGMMLLSPLGLIQRKKKAKDPITPDDFSELEKYRDELLAKVDDITTRTKALEEKINSLEGKPTAAPVKKAPEERITKVSDLDKKTSDAKELMLALAAKNKKRKPLFKSTTAHNAVSRLYCYFK